jgi:hypothetical protein
VREAVIRLIFKIAANATACSKIGTAAKAQLLGRPANSQETYIPRFTSRPSKKGK